MVRQTVRFSDLWTIGLDCGFETHLLWLGISCGIWERAGSQDSWVIKAGVGCRNRLQVSLLAVACFPGSGCVSFTNINELFCFLPKIPLPQSAWLDHGNNGVYLQTDIIPPFLYLLCGTYHNAYLSDTFTHWFAFIVLWPEHSCEKDLPLINLVFKKD